MSFPKFLKECIDDMQKDIYIFRFSQWGNSWGATYQGKKLKKPARISIEMPTEVCNKDLRDLEKWKMFIIAIPIKRWEDHLKEVNKENKKVEQQQKNKTKGLGVNG